jgi:hypothetical protein
VCNHHKVLSYEAGRDDRGLDISKFAYGVGTSNVCATQYTKVKLESPSMCKTWPRNTGDRKVKHGSQSCVIDISLVYL